MEEQLIERLIYIFKTKGFLKINVDLKKLELIL